MAFKLLIVILITSYNCLADNEIPTFSIITDASPGVSVLHGLTKLTDALQAKRITFEKIRSIKEARGAIIIVAGLSSGANDAAKILKEGNRSLPETSEALTIWKTKYQNKSVWVISGIDDSGLMYGLQDVAIQISWSINPENPMSEVKEITEKPDVSERAISFYTMNRSYWESRFYDEVYWSKYLDLLAQNRFNSMVVIFGYENGGFLAPCYPYFFDLESYPDIRMIGITAKEQEKNLNALKKLILMAHERGIRFSVGIWDHIYRGGVQGGGIPGTKDTPDQPVHGLVWGVNSNNLISYTKSALEKFVWLVPGLDGIQFRMHNESGLKKEEQGAFWSDIFKMMKKTTPNLRFDLRAKELPEEVVQSALNEGIKFRITTKFWMEQMGLPYHPTQINPEKSPRRQSYGDLLRYPQQYKMHWRLWNGGTSRILLWGDPEYVRRFAESSHLYNGDGYEVNEPLATKMEAQPHDAQPFNLLNAPYRYYRYEFERYWHFFQIFGRIGYNPQTSDTFWNREFEARFGKKAAPLIEKAMHKASWILPRIVSSVYPYSGFPMTRGWAEKQHLGNLESYAKNSGTDIQQFANFDEEASILIEGGETAKILPSMNSRWFEESAFEINKLISKAEKEPGNSGNKEFKSTITDLKILANLALYHSYRIPAAVSYCIFERTKDPTAFDDAVAYERKAVEAWRQIVISAGDVYTNDLMMGVRGADLCGHWSDELAELEKGLISLEQTRILLKPQIGTKKGFHYQEASNSDWQQNFHVIHQPMTGLQSGKPATIRVKVSSDKGIKSVVLNYRSVNQDVDYQTLIMLPTKEKDFFEATVPAVQINQKYDFMYFISLINNERQGIIYPDLNDQTPYFIVKLVRK